MCTCMRACSLSVAFLPAAPASPHVARSVPPARSFARYFAAVDAASAACVDVALVHGRFSQECRRKDPRCRVGTTGLVFSPSEDKSSDPRGTEAYLRKAGRVRRPVVGSSPERRTRSLSKTGELKGR